VNSIFGMKFNGIGLYLEKSVIWVGENFGDWFFEWTW